ncbi:MAG: hypothetical protein AB4426_16120 [Xenococcaceae cyanobacterium]
MKTDFDILTNKDLFVPVVFRSNFNKFESINANQAWSLFFTAGQDDNKLGLKTELGKFFTYLLIAVGVTGTVWALIFSNFA